MARSNSSVVTPRRNSGPKAVVLRLYLKGLSSFRASNGKVTLGAAVSIQDGKLQVRLWKDRKEDDRLDEKSPLWMDIRILSSDGKPADKIPEERLLRDNAAQGVLRRQP